MYISFRHKAMKKNNQILTRMYGERRALVLGLDAMLFGVLQLSVRMLLLVVEL